MDEFDVFMDAVSRNVAIKQLTEYAKLDNTRQFILLTPGVRTVGRLPWMWMLLKSWGSSHIRLK